MSEFRPQLTEGVKRYKVTVKRVFVYYLDGNSKEELRGEVVKMLGDGRLSFYSDAMGEAEQKYLGKIKVEKCLG